MNSGQTIRFRECNMCMRKTCACKRWVKGNEMKVYKTGVCEWVCQISFEH